MRALGRAGPGRCRRSLRAEPAACCALRLHSFSRLAPALFLALSAYPHCLPPPCPRPLPPCSASFHAVREGLKWRAKDAEAVDALHATAPDLVAVYRQLQGQPDGVPGERCWGGVSVCMRVLAGCPVAGVQSAACPRAAPHPPAPARPATPAPAAPEQLRVRLGHCIRRLKQLWPAGCVVASLLHSNPEYGGAGVDGAPADAPPGAAALAAASGLESTDEPEPGTQRRCGKGCCAGVQACWAAPAVTVQRRRRSLPCRGRLAACP